MFNTGINIKWDMIITSFILFVHGHKYSQLYDEMSNPKLAETLIIFAFSFE